jgi:hypothetical protein
MRLARKLRRQDAEKSAAEPVQAAAGFAVGQIVASLQPAEDGFSVEIDDLRYGQLGAAERGLRAIRGHFDRGGSLRTPIEFVTHADGGRLVEALAALWRASWGDFSGLGLEPG